MNAYDCKYLLYQLKFVWTIIFHITLAGQFIIDKCMSVLDVISTSSPLKDIQVIFIFKIIFFRAFYPSQFFTSMDLKIMVPLSKMIMRRLKDNSGDLSTGNSFSG